MVIGRVFHSQSQTIFHQNRATSSQNTRLFALTLKVLTLLAKPDLLAKTDPLAKTESTRPKA